MIEAWDPERVARLEADGIVAVRGFVERAAAGRALARIDAVLATGKGLNRPTDLSRLPSDLLCSYADERRARGIDMSQFKIPEADLARGPDAYRDRCNLVTLRDPLRAVPELLDWGLREPLLEATSAYLGGAARLGYVKVKRSFANGLPCFDTNFFHVDDNADRIVKILVYLNDVDLGGGPFTYVEGSHRQRFEGWDRKVLFEDDEILAQYAKAEVREWPGSAGDAFWVDTKGFHRESRARERDRTVAIFDYVVEEEYGGRHGRPRVPSERLAHRSERARRSGTVEPVDA